MNTKKIKTILALGSTLSLVACSSTTTQEETKTNEVSNNLNKDIQLNEMVLFGQYAKTNNTPEAIEWIVLEDAGDKVLLITKNCIDSLPWHNTKQPITWDNSDIRSLLNNEFLNKAFTTTEQESIIETVLDNSDQLNYGTTAGENTKDKVFLLSGLEMQKYFESESARRAQPTAYAIAQGAFANSNGDCAYWLRSPGVNATSPSYIASPGIFGNRAHEVNETIIGVRPALWVSKAKLQS